MSFITLFILSLYFLFLIYAFIGIYRAQEDISCNVIENFSVIICSNKSSVLGVLNSLKNSTNNGYKFEVVVVDDRSNPAILINKEDYDFDINLIRIDDVKENISPKKNALQIAIKSAKYNKIVTLDDDTIVDEKYLDFASRIDVDINNYVVGLIKPYTNEHSFFSNIAILDFIATNLISIGCVKQNLPIYTNANNQIFNKKAFLEINPYDDNIHILGGDDTFLLQKMFVNKKTINAFYNNDFITQTEVPNTIENFLRQRLRWFTKQHEVVDNFSLFAKAVLYFSNLVLFFTIFINPVLFIKLLIAKTVFEGALIYQTLKKFNLTNKLPYFILMEIFQIVYIVLVPIYGVVKGNKKW